MTSPDPDLFARAAFAIGASDLSIVERVQSLWKGYGEIYRVRALGIPPGEGNGPGRGTIIAKWIAPARIPASPSDARKYGSYGVERTFYRRYAERCPAAARVPRPLAIVEPYGPGGSSLLLLEDLDAAGFNMRVRLPTHSALDQMLAWLAAFHAQFLGAPPDGLWPEGSYWHLETRRDDLGRIADPGLRRAAPDLDERLRQARFRTLVHGDAKPANFCLSPACAVAAVDFQYAGGGSGMRDVAYLLADPFGKLSPVEENRSLDVYLAGLRAALHSTAVDCDDLETESRALYPIAKADYFRFLAGWAPDRWHHAGPAQHFLRSLLRVL